MPVGAQLLHDNVLWRRLEHQRGEDPQQVVPLADDQLRVQPPSGLHQQLGVLHGVLEAAQSGADLLLDATVARGELIAENVEQSTVDFVRPVGVSPWCSRRYRATAVFAQKQPPVRCWDGVDYWVGGSAEPALRHDSRKASTAS